MPRVVSIAQTGHLPSVSTLELGCVVGGGEQTDSLWGVATVSVDGSTIYTITHLTETTIARSSTVLTNTHLSFPRE